MYAIVHFCAKGGGIKQKHRCSEVSLKNDEHKILK